MAKKSDIDFSLQGEQAAKTEKLESNKIEDGIVGDLRATNGREDTKYYIFKLVNNTRKGGVYIPNIDDVLNPETGKVERMRLLSGVPSVWLKDQKDLSPEYVRQNGRSIHFIRGTRLIQIPEHDDTALTFMRLSSHNVGSKSKKLGSPYEFYEYDAAKEERAAFEREDFEIEMAILAKKQEPEAMRKHAAFLGIRLLNDLGIPKTDDGVRTEYTRYAKRNPKYFQDTIGSKQVEIGWLVRKGIVDSMIEIGREPGKIFWANGGGMICVLPKQEDAIKYLVDLAMTNSQEGKTFLEQLQTTVK